MRTILLCVVCATALVSEASANPVHLNCMLGSEANPGALHLDVTLNEANGTASYLILETGHSRHNIPAMFAAGEVTFRTEQSFGASNLYRIDRVSLAFSNDVGSVDGGVLARLIGACTVAAVPERAF